MELLGTKVIGNLDCVLLCVHHPPNNAGGCEKFQNTA
jgi:hypothetical protein